MKPVRKYYSILSNLYNLLKSSFFFSHILNFTSFLLPSLTPKWGINIWTFLQKLNKIKTLPAWPKRIYFLWDYQYSINAFIQAFYLSRSGIKRKKTTKLTSTASKFLIHSGVIFMFSCFQSYFYSNAVCDPDIHIANVCL